MKKIFILSLLLVPIMVHADPVGPSAVGQGQTAVIATASAPYATATAENGDTTNVVSASYVKGAYNDAIAAVNKVGKDLSDGLDSLEDSWATIFEQQSMGIIKKFDNMNNNISRKRINAVTTWGNDTPTQLELSSLPAQP